MRTRVLLVEDDENDVELTLRALEKIKLRDAVVVVRDGLQALDFLFARGAFDERNAEELPEVVLLDLNLPGLDGQETLRRIRQDERTRLLPVVILSSSAAEKDMMEAYASGANSYVQKPVDFDAFVEATRQLGLYWLTLNRRPSAR